LTLETILARCGATSPAECYRADVSGCALARVADEDDDAAEEVEEGEDEEERSRSRMRVFPFPRVRLSVLPLAPYLAHLDASDNDLRWRDLATLSRLSALRRVSLAANRLGDDSDEGSRGARFALGGEETSGGGFVPFRSLTSLDLAHNDIGHEALAALSRLPRLETLSLASCRVRALPAEAFFDEESEEDSSVFFPCLRSLDLSRQTSAAGDPNSHDALRASACDFLDVLGAMPRLERLSLRRNARLDAFPFPTLSSRAVHVRSSPLRAGVDFPSLVFLDLRDSGVARPEALQPLAALGAGRPGGRLREVALAGTDAATRLTRDAEARGAEFFAASRTGAGVAAKSSGARRSGGGAGGGFKAIRTAVTQRRASAAAVAARRRGAVAAGALRVVASLCDADESFAPSPRVIGDGENHSFSDDDARVCVAVALEEHAPSSHSASGAFITLEPPANISRARANASGANAPRFDFVRMRDAFGYRPRSLAETKARFRLVAEDDDEDPLGVNDPDAIVRGLVAKTERTLAIGARRELAKDYRVVKGRKERALAKAHDAEARERERREAWENGEFAKAYRERAARKKTEETGEAGGERARKTKAGEAAKDVLAAAPPKKERAPEGEAPEDVFGDEDGKERPTVVPGFFETGGGRGTSRDADSGPAARILDGGARARATGGVGEKVRRGGGTAPLAERRRVE
jgi:hypothetical protein